MTYNTPPGIRTDDCPPGLFEPLLDSWPHLSSVVRLISLGGEILEKLYSRPYSHNRVLELESTMGNVCARIGKPLSRMWHQEQNFESRYEVLLHVHMFWCV